MPKPPAMFPTPVERAAEPLNDDDVSFILNDTLQPHHRDDATILAFIRSFLHTNSVRQTAQELGLKYQTANAIRNRKDIALVITKIRDTAALKHGLDPHEIVARVKEIADVDPAQLMKPDGTFIENMNEIPHDVRRVIKKFKAKNLYENDSNGIPQVVGKLIEVEFWDKLKANELLGRDVELFKETKKLELDVTNNMASLLLQSKERAETRALEAREAKRLSPRTTTVIDVSPEAHGAYKLMSPPEGEE